MILVDSSIWIDHLRTADQTMLSLLGDKRVVLHPYVIGEIALGHIRQRAVVLGMLKKIHSVPVAKPGETLLIIELHQLFGLGLGYVDVHLLASTLLAPGTNLWTRDKRLKATAERLGVAAAGLI